MEKQEYKDEYYQRSSVEVHLILNEQFDIKNGVIIGMVRTLEILNLDALEYNLIR